MAASFRSFIDMATSPLGGFADLSSYRRNLDLQKAQQLSADPLADLILSAQQGYALQQLPQTMLAQEQAKVDAALATQLKNALAMEQLTMLRNPNEALLRDIQKNLAVKTVDPTTGIVVAPVGLESEIIATPGALTAEQQLAVEAGGPVPTVAGGTPIQPITIGGRPTGFSQDLDRAITSTEQINRAKGTSALERQLLSNAQKEADRLSRESIAAAGNVSREKVAETRGKSGSGGLTASRISIIAGKAGEAGFTQEDIDEKYTRDGVVDWNRVSLDANREIAKDVETAAKLKAAQLPASLREKASGFIAAHADLGKLTTTLKQFKIEGKEPDSWQRAVGVALESPPGGVFSALYQTVIGQGLNADVREINALKARVRSAVVRANAGLSQTEREIANVSQYTPSTNDTLEQTLQKAAGLEGYLINQVEAITIDPNDWLKSFETGANGGTVPPPSPVSGSSPLDKLRQKYAR